MATSPSVAPTWKERLNVLTSMEELGYSVKDICPLLLGFVRPSFVGYSSSGLEGFNTSSGTLPPSRGFLVLLIVVIAFSWTFFRSCVAVKVTGVVEVEVVE